MEISGNDTTARDPSVMGCSGSVSLSASVSSEDGLEDLKNGSEEWEGAGMEKTPPSLVEGLLEARAFRFRVGRSDGLRTSGFAFLPGSMILWMMCWNI